MTFPHLPVTLSLLPIIYSTPASSISIVSQPEFSGWHGAECIDQIDQTAISKCELQLFDGDLTELFLYQHIQQCVSQRVFHIRRTQVAYHSLSDTFFFC